MEVSIAMAIFNGEKYLLKQLESIYQQTVQIDELIACDDGSTDSSQKIFENFVENHGLKGKWRFIKNSENKGYAKNFLDCAALCSKDIIFFSDQDDIWHSKKVEKIVDVFCKYDDAMAVCCSTKNINEDDQECKSLSTTGHPDDGTIRKVSFESQVKSMRSSGLTLAFRRSVFLPTKDTIEKYGLHYDTPFGLIYAAKGQFYRIYEPLVFHRIHSSNAGNPSYSLRTRSFDNHIGSRKNQLKILEAVLKDHSDNLSVKQKKVLLSEITARRQAIKNMEKRRVIPLFISMLRIGTMDNKKIDVINFILTAKAKISRR